MSVFFSLEEWFDIANNGTRGDQVMDILYSWKADREALQKRIAELEDKNKKLERAYRDVTSAMKGGLR